METPNTDLSEWVERYTEQPGRMPAETRERFEQAWNGSPVQLYALGDLCADLKLTKTWVALGEKHVAIAHEAGVDEAGRVNDGAITSFERSRLRKVLERPGLSCTTLTLLGDPNEPPLGILRYTHRQKRAMANIQFVLEEQLKGVAAPVAVCADGAYAKAVTEPIREAQATSDRGRLAVVLRLLTYLKPYRKEVIYGMTGAVLMTGMALVPPYLTGLLIDHVIRPYEAGTLSAAAAWHQARLAVLGIACALGMKEVFAFVRLRTMSMMGEEVARDLRTEVYAHLQELSLSFFSSKQTGSLISRITSDSDRIWDFIAFGIVEVSVALLMLTGLSAVLISLDPWLGLVVAGSLPPLLYAVYRHGQRMQRLFLRCWRTWSKVTDVLSETIPGIRVVKAFRQESHEKARFAKRNQDIMVEFRRIHMAWTSFWPLLMTGVHLAVVSVWLLALPRLLSHDHRPLSAGTFVSFLFYLTMLSQPVEVIGQMARMLNRATSSAYRIFELLDTEPDMHEVEKPVVLKPVEGSVRFENVSFGYDGVRTVLKGADFEVKPGEMIGLVGPSGSGKTTLINLIARFYDPTGGRVLIDGHDLTTLELSTYRKQVGMVLQDPYLFHGSVLDNIRYGLQDAPFERVLEAARAANAHDFIARLPHGYDTTVGERGHTLSGGERQRISIARAVLHDPRILILDEATSSVDTETERKIQEALDRLIAGRTVFAIAHRLSTLTRANRLIVLEHGRITETGTHAELLAREGGTYRKLHTMQQELHHAYAL